MTVTLMRVMATLVLISSLPAAIQARQQKDEGVILQFQRAADAYAFQHRQIERRSAAPATLVEGAFFTPAVAAAFRDRLRAAGCPIQKADDSGFVVPRVNSSADGTNLLPSCASAALPGLPPELEYRFTGVALILADAHRHVVVDILHAAWPARDN